MKIRRTIGTAVTMGALALGLSLPATGPANAAVQEKITFTWNSMRSGDCEFMPGATWTLYSSGMAVFDGTVFSRSGDDAWLMWPRLQDKNYAQLGEMTVYGIAGNNTKFVKNLPRSWQRYRWFAQGWFDPSLFPLIKHMSLGKHC